MCESTASRGVRVLIVLPTLRVGGAERQAACTAIGLQAQGFCVSIAALSADGPIAHLLSKHDIPFYILENKAYLRGPGIGKLAHLGGLWRFRQLLRRIRPDIVHSYLPVPNVYSAVGKAVSLSHFRLLVSKRSLGNYKAGRPLLARAERWANRVADGILVNSEAVAKDVLLREKASRGKIYRIYNGVEVPTPTVPRANLRATLGWPMDRNVIGVISNLHPWKGLEDFVRACSIVRQSHCNTHFAVIGRDAGYGDVLRCLVEAENLADCFQLLGQRTDVSDILHALDVVVHPSHGEGFSNAILEAMASGKPLVVTDVGGNGEAVQDGVSGLVVPARAPHELARAIQCMLEKPDEAAEMGARARFRAETEFSVTRLITETMRLYETLLSTEESRSTDSRGASKRQGM